MSFHFPKAPTSYSCRISSSFLPRILFITNSLSNPTGGRTTSCWAASRTSLQEIRNCGVFPGADRQFPSRNRGSGNARSPPGLGRIETTGRKTVLFCQRFDLLRRLAPHPFGDNFQDSRRILFPQACRVVFKSRVVGELRPTIARHSRRTLQARVPPEQRICRRSSGTCPPDISRHPGCLSAAAVCP